MVVRLDAPQPTFTLPPVDEIPDEAEDKPQFGKPLVRASRLSWASC